MIVVTLLAYGCPPQAIVHALGLDERTVARWQERAGAHCHKVHEDQIVQGQLDLIHVQADELRVKGCQMIRLYGSGDHGPDTTVSGRSGEHAS